jgi:MFS family permease
VRSLTTLPRSGTATADAPAGFFYGWVIVWTVFLVLLTGAGLGFYLASVILRAGVKELGLSVQEASLGPTLFFSISGLTGFLLAKKLNEVDLRWFYLAGGVVGSVSLFSLRWVDTLATYYVFFAVYGISFALAGLVPGTTLVARWFDRRRPTALSLASTGLSMGGIVLTPLAADSIADHGLASSATWMAIVWFVGVVPLALLLLRNFPADRGLEPDGAPTPPQPRPVAGAAFAVALRTRYFRWLCLTYGMIFLAQVGAIAHLYSLASERVDVATAGVTVATLAFTSVLARLASGLVLRWMSTKTLTTVLTVAQAAALICLSLANSRLTLLASTVFFGMSVGNLLMLQPLLLAEAFGVKEYSRIYSLNQLAGTIGVAGGPYLLGFLHDQADYRLAFWVAAMANVIGFGALLLAGPTARAQRLWQEPAPVTSTPVLAQSARA